MKTCSAEGAQGRASNNFAIVYLQHEFMYLGLLRLANPGATHDLPVDFDAMYDPGPRRVIAHT
jgi:hypothetical protein